MDETKKIVDAITEGIQEKKGHKIVIADLTEIEDSVFDYFVICEAESATQVQAIADSVEDTVREKTKVKPAAVAGFDYAEWVAMDYGQVIVHVFQPQSRRFYDLEHLWADATLTEIPDEEI